MIALDTSSILAVLLNEPEGEAFGRIIACRAAMVGAPTIVEARPAYYPAL